MWYTILDTRQGGRDYYSIDGSFDFDPCFHSDPCECLDKTDDACDAIKFYDAESAHAFKNGFGLHGEVVARTDTAT
jgi:hypothetical protein